MSELSKPQSSELHPGPGHRIRTKISRSAASVVDAYRQFETPDISDTLNRLYTMTSVIHNQINDMSIAGPACTVKIFPGDNLMVHKALDIAQPGDIIVVDAGSSTMNAIIGDMIAAKAKHRKIEGFVIDGLVRDLPAMQEVGLPVLARGVTPIGPLHRGPGEINFPVSCGGIVVVPGDLIVGDRSGVVVVPQVYAEDALERLRARRDALMQYVQNVRKGVFSNAWVDKILEDTGCTYVSE